MRLLLLIANFNCSLLIANCYLILQQLIANC